MRCEKDYISYYPTVNNHPYDVVVYCHGGAFRYGTTKDDAAFLSKLSNELSANVYSAGFRNIDQARNLRNMIEDILQCMEEISRTGTIKRFHLVGASSGAYLAWILSIMLDNRGRYGIKTDIAVESTILISGYLMFGRNDGITTFLEEMYPGFQGFPKDLRNVTMDYSGYELPRTMLVTGEDDSCLEDSKSLYECLKKTGSITTELIIAASDRESTEHCFLVKNPDSNALSEVFQRIRRFIWPTNQISNPVDLSDSE